ncbi:MAG: hypothetical protein R3279_12170, partial [Putridiphycobacter sp.]|nr:hypothetical protein [Putridiphycobacter sp.]
MKKTILMPLCIAAITLAACKDKKKDSATEVAVEEPAVIDSKVGVTKDNFAYAMADLAMQKEFVQGADNTWNHHRKPMPLDEQPAPLMNRDTNYSFAILDGGGDVAVTLPENDGRY